MNLTKLANLSGVSIATVSKAFSGSDEISAETRERIFKIAKETGCYDKYNKNRFNKKVIAVFCPELNSNYYNNLITIMDKKITEAGGIMTVSVTDFSAEREEELFAYYSYYCKVDGIITINQKIKMSSCSIPYAALYPNDYCCPIDAITSNTYDAFKDALIYLKNNGHKTIGFIGEPLTTGKAKLFTKIISELDLHPDQSLIYISESRFEQAGIDGTKHLLDNSDIKPTAIVTAYDYIAIGVIKELQNRGISVPEDISVIGTNDINILPYLETPIATLSTNSELGCSEAVKLVMDKIKGIKTKHEPILIPTIFVPRASVGKAK